MWDWAYKSNGRKPQDDDADEDEDDLDWKRRMSIKAGIVDIDDSRLEDLNFREVIKPEWRSEEVSVF